MENKKEFEAIICIVKTGFADSVIDASREAGARGGTLLDAKGSGNLDSEKFHGIIIHPEQELVLIVVPKEIKDNVLKVVYQKIGLEGVAFSIPISCIAGISEKEEEEKLL